LGTYLAKETYNNLENVVEVKCPVFVVHGRQDSLIPIEHARELISTSPLTQTTVAARSA
jgi:pimeloyl-ACP methyl ester carboxylesterase